MNVLDLKNDKNHLEIKIVHDGDGESPRSWDNFGHFFTWERNYPSPDENPYEDGVDFIASILGEELTQKIHKRNSNSGEFMSEVIPRLDEKGYILYPVSRYEHTGVRYFLGTSSGWDTGTVGVIFVSKAEVYDTFKVKRITQKVRQKVEQAFEASLADYTRYANGEVYGFQVLRDGVIIDSCYGFYEDMLNKDTALKVVSENFEIGDIEDWNLLPA